MKTRILLVVTALLGMFSVQAQTPVTLQKLSNPITGGTLKPTAAGMLIFGDYNNDGKLDGFIAAGQGADTQTLALYKNNGDYTFSSASVGEIMGVTRGSAAWIDFDNDGNLDLVVGGVMLGMPTVILYKNSGAPDYTFTEVQSASSVLPVSAIENQDHNPRVIYPLDYNNDGWMDLLINGQTSEDWQGMGRVVALFKNNHGTFEFQATPVDGSNFRGVNGGGVNVGDVNNDGYVDILLSGYLDDVGGVTDLYINNKNGGFTRASSPTFTGHQEGENFFIDVNNDGWQDIIEIGRDIKNGWSGFTNLFINNQGSGFTKTTNPFGGGSAVIAIGDINNDGNMDVMTAGYASNAKIAYGKGDGTFTSVALPNDEQARGGFINFVDMNNDNSLDMTIFGYSDGAGGFINNFYKATGAPANAAPAVPANATYSGSNGKYILTWDKSTDDHTATNAIRYNVAFTFPDGKKFTYVPADPATGKIKVNGLQAFIISNSIEVNVPEGTKFAVQAVDQAGVGSAFSAVKTIGTGIKDLAVNSVKVFAADKRIAINNEGKTVKYSILSINGQTVQSGVCTGKTLSAPLASGVYLVKVTDGNAVQTTKVTVF
ncbi:MAG: T9SS type A sorting domain-containing protein [Dysgonamonadaceae bacterium]|jgi:hypothetical protein|nr:T9SS type A sorting domain-containing protein [Dysgonamonadaceae bacterium]